MMISLDIETHDKSIGFHIASVGNSLAVGNTIEAPGGARLEFRGIYGQKALGFSEILQFVVDASVTIDLGLFSAWLYDKVRGKQVERVVINRKEITEITQENIRKVLEEEIKINE